MLNVQILSLLRSFVQGAPPEKAEQLDSSFLWRCAEQQSLLPILAYQNKRWGLFDDEKLNCRLESILYGAIANNTGRCTDFDELSAAFTQHGIRHMPVKGYYLRRVYPLPALRNFGDIDVLIHAEDRKKSDELLRSLGYTVDHDWEPTYSYIKGMEHYEIHTNMMDCNLDDRADLQAYFDRAWDYAEPDEGLRFAPSLDFHFIYTVCHLAKHLYTGGAGLRMYLDIALYVKCHDADLNWTVIKEEFEALHFVDFFYTVMNASRVWFGVDTVCPLPEPDEKALDKLLDYTLESDLFGHSRDHSVVSLRNDSDGKVSKVKVIFNMLFPPASQIERRYTFLQGRHWLLPIAWIKRLFANSNLISSRVRNMKRISEVESDDVSTYDKFMKRIGL